MKNKELLPCPFCGKKPTIYRSIFSEKYRVRCDGKGGRGAETASFGLKEKAITAWNTRTNTIPVGNGENYEVTHTMIDGKEYAKQMRENAVTDNNGIIIISEELWQQIANTIGKQQAEIERLKKENKILSENADTAFQDGLNEAQDLYAEQVKNEVRAEAIREFAERLKEKFLNAFDSYAYVTYGDIVMAIENIVKEIAGEQK